MRSLVLMLAALLTTGVSADAVQGTDYRTLAPKRASINNDSKLEVVEFFSYACPHCAHFNPGVTKWASALPEDTVFVKVPVSFGRPQWGQLVRAYYALEATGELSRFDAALFKAIHEERKPLFDEQSLSAWIAEKGGDAAKFREAFNSPAISQKALRADQLSRDYQVSGVPQITVNGKHAVIGQTFEDVLRIASELVEKERSSVKGAQSE